MNDVRSGKVNCIVVKDLSRFGRNYKEAGHYLEHIFPYLGVRFVAINDHFDTADQGIHDGYTNSCTAAKVASSMIGAWVFRATRHSSAYASASREKRRTLDRQIAQVKQEQSRSQTLLDGLYQNLVDGMLTREEYMVTGSSPLPAESGAGLQLRPDRPILYPDGSHHGLRFWKPADESILRC